MKIEFKWPEPNNHAPQKTDDDAGNPFQDGTGFEQVAKDLAPTSWRSIYPVHPCAHVLRMLPDDELADLAADIKANGLRAPVVLWRDTSTQPEPQTWYVLDGRNRLDALERLGIRIPTAPTSGRVSNALGIDVHLFRLTQSHAWGTDRETGGRGDGPRHRLEPHESVTSSGLIHDPAAFVISANIHRRHLRTKEEQAEMIVRAIAARPPIAQPLARSVKRESDGRLGGSTKDPVLAQAVVEAKKHGISKRTVQNARAKLQGKTIVRTRSKTPPSTAKAPPPSTARSDALMSVAPQLMDAAVVITHLGRPRLAYITALLEWIGYELDERFDDDAEHLWEGRERPSTADEQLRAAYSACPLALRPRVVAAFATMHARLKRELRKTPKR